MAVTQNTKNEPWECLSTDTKPITRIKNGQKILEIDTSKIYVFNSDGAAWVENKSANSTAEEISLGQIGNKAITGTSAVTPASGYYFVAIQVISDIVVSTQGNVTGALNADLSAFTIIPAGTILYGKWDSITLTSGEAIGHYGEV